MYNKKNLIWSIVLVLSLSSCIGEKNVEVKKENVVKKEQVKIDVEKSVSDFDEKLIEEVVEPLLEIKN